LCLLMAGCQAAGGGTDGGDFEDGYWQDAGEEAAQEAEELFNEEGEESIEPACLPWAGLRDQALREVLHDFVNGHRALSYDQARQQIFTFVDNHDGWVECVYTGEKVQTSGIPDIDIMNIEHTWCQSWGANTLPAKSDLNHLFPVAAAANSARSNYPFGKVELVSWESGGSKLGLDGWGNTVFEPRDVHKGDAARAIFYFSIRYAMGVDDRMEETLRKWNWQDPPDAKEIERADKIESIQERRNPLVDCPRLVDWISNF
jgi:deoxyribonuclease-1